MTSNGDYNDTEERGQNISTGCSQELQKAVESYLETLKNEEFCDPKIKRQQKHLQELLESYKKLCSKLDQKAENDEQNLNFKPFEVNPKRSEIEALLNPELYKNKREEEKDKLISKFSTKRIFTDVERVLPPTPQTYSVDDIRQNEKERFIRLISSAPSRFHNVVDASPKVKSRKFIRYTPKVAENARESEKERLARIFATSAVFLKKPSLQKKIFGKKLFSTEPKNIEHQKNVETIDLVDHENFKPSQEPNEMVRMGEYSPLNANYSHRTVLGVGEHDERKKMLDKERHSEYVHHLANIAQTKADKAMLDKERHSEYVHHLANIAQTKADKAIMTQESQRTRMNSVSTQTNDELIVEENDDGHSPTHPSPNLSPRKQQLSSFTPREKLISDLYGSPYNDEKRPNGYLEMVKDEKQRQIEYAEALRQQIEEKKRLERERKRREKEDEEIIDKMVQEQSRRLELEYEREQNQKLDWIQQRQAQEEILRRKLIEMSLEAKELKKQEKLRRVNAERRFTVAPKQKRNISLRPLITSQQPQEEVKRALRDFEEIHVGRKENVRSLPEQLPQPNWDDSPSKYIQNVHGVDLLREYRTQKERMQLPPLIDRPHAQALPEASAEEILKAPLNGYIPSANEEPRRSKSVLSVHNDELPRSRSVNSFRRQAEELLRAPIDAEIAISPDHSPDLSGRPPSPVLPAVRSETLLKHNIKRLDDRWKIPPPSNNELDRTVNQENILSQLGAFRRQLAREHQRLEKRLEQRS